MKVIDLNERRKTRMSDFNFTVVGEKIVCEDLNDYTLDIKANVLKSKRCFDSLEFPESIFVKAESFHGYTLTDDTCIVEGHVGYSFAGVRIDMELNFECAIYAAGVEVPEIYIDIELGKQEDWDT